MVIITCMIRWWGLNEIRLSSSYRMADEEYISGCLPLTDNPPVFSYFPLAFRDINVHTARLESPQMQCQCSFMKTWSLLVLTIPSLSPSWAVCLVPTVTFPDRPRTGPPFPICLSRLTYHWGSLSSGGAVPRHFIGAGVSYQTLPLNSNLVRKHNIPLEWTTIRKDKEENCQIRENLFHKLFIIFHSLKLNSALDWIANGTKLFLGSCNFFFHSLGSYHLWLY